MQSKKKKHIKAAKIIPKVDRHGEETKSLALEEKNIMKKVHSPYICEMEEFFEQDKDFILIMEYIEGQDLYELLKDSKDKPLSLKESIKIMR